MIYGLLSNEFKVTPSFSLFSTLTKWSMSLLLCTAVKGYFWVEIEALVGG